MSPASAVLIRSRLFRLSTIAHIKPDRIPGLECRHRAGKLSLQPDVDRQQVHRGKNPR